MIRVEVVRVKQQLAILVKMIWVAAIKAEALIKTVLLFLYRKPRLALSVTVRAVRRVSLKMSELLRLL